jgi:glutaredoxin-like protein NrdH
MGATDAGQVQVFGREGCVQCKATCRALTERGIAFECVDVDADPDAAATARRVAQEGGSTQLPVVQVPGMAPWTGFHPDLINAIVSEAV